MQTIGILGGMSLESTLTYISALNRCINQRLGGLHSPRLVVCTVDFDDIERLQSSGQWDRAGQVLHEAAVRLEAAGADFIIMATNTMHKVAPMITAGLAVPFLHIAEATGEALKRDGLSRVGLLGTRFTMQDDFYREALENCGIEVLVPTLSEQELVNSVIYEELCKGLMRERSAAQFQRIIEALGSRGAQGVILGCTEIGMLVDQASVPIYDTTQIHVAAAAQRALESGSLS